FFGIAHDQHIRQAIVVTAPNLAADGPRARLDFGSKAVEFVSYRFRVVDVVVAHRKDSDLFGREPEREIATKVLDEDAHEPFETPEECAMDGHGPVFVVVLADVGQVEAFGDVEIYLYRADRPLAPERVERVDGDF